MEHRRRSRGVEGWAGMEEDILEHGSRKNVILACVFVQGNETDECIPIPPSPPPPRDFQVMIARLAWVNYIRGKR